MKIEVKDCATCPFSNKDSELGNDSCNLAYAIGKPIVLKNWFDNLPSDKRHKKCPIKSKVEIVVAP